MPKPEEEDDDEFENEEEDDDDEESDEEDDDDGDDEEEVTPKEEIIETIAEAMAEIDVAVVDVVDDKIIVTMNDESKYRISVRKIG